MKKRVYSGNRKKPDDFYFDDCYVCQETKKADEEGKMLSTEKLKEIFEKANHQN